jgi:hypothetical protein
MSVLGCISRSKSGGGRDLPTFHPHPRFAARVVTPGVFGLRTIIVGEGDIVEREQGMMVVL